MKGQGKNSGFRGTMREMGPYVDLGMRFALSMTFGVLGGLWLDKKLSTAPFLLIAGFLIGAAAGFWSIYRVVYLKDQTKRRDKNG